jgi:hypothetical protein
MTSQAKAGLQNVRLTSVAIAAQVLLNARIGPFGKVGGVEEDATCLRCLRSKNSRRRRIPPLERAAVVASAGTLGTV